MCVTDNEGWIKLWRKIRYSRLWPGNCDRPFTEFEAFIDLILSATYRDRQVHNITLKRGQVLTSIVRLSKRWKRHRNTVRNWISTMEQLGELCTGLGTGSCTVLTVVKFDEYQQDSSPSNKGSVQVCVQDSVQHTVQDSVHIQEEKKIRREEKSGGGRAKRAPKDGTPHERVKWWVADNQQLLDDLGKAQFMSTGEILEEVAKAKTWVLANPQKGNKQNWRRFFGGWFVRFRENKVKLRDPLGHDQEQKHYADKRRSGPSSDLKPLGSILPGGSDDD